MQINVSDRGAMVLALAGGLIAAFALAPDAMMGVVDVILGFFGGSA